jgi:hypothetical protein
MKHLYHRFVATNGTVERLLAGHDGEGWEHIETVRVLRARPRSPRHTHARWRVFPPPPPRMRDRNSLCCAFVYVTAV